MDKGPVVLDSAVYDPSAECIVLKLHNAPAIHITASRAVLRDLKAAVTDYYAHLPRHHPKSDASSN